MCGARAILSFLAGLVKIKFDGVMMYKNRLIKICLLFFVGAIAIWASDGNVTADDFANFKDIVNTKIDVLDKRIGDFYAVAGWVTGAISTFFSILFVFIAYKGATELSGIKDDFKNLKAEAKTEVDSIVNKNEKLDKLLEDARKAAVDAKNSAENANKSSQKLDEILQKTEARVDKVFIDNGGLDATINNEQQMNKVIDSEVDVVSKEVIESLEIQKSDNQVQDTSIQAKSTKISSYVNFAEYHREALSLKFPLTVDWDWAIDSQEKNKILEKFTNSLQQMDKDIFIKLLFQSFSLGKNEKLRVISEYPKLSEFQYRELIKVFIVENKKFIELQIEHPADIAKLKYKTLKDWIMTICSVLKLTEEEEKNILKIYIFDLLLKSHIVFGFSNTEFVMISESVAIELYRLNELKYACNLLEKAISFANDNNDDINLYLLLMRLKFKQEKYEDILVLIETAIDKFSNDEKAMLELYDFQRQTYLKCKLYKKAENSYLNIKKLQSNSYILLDYIEMLIIQERFNEAQEVYESSSIDFQNKESQDKYSMILYWLFFIIYVCKKEDIVLQTKYKKLFDESLDEFIDIETNWNTQDIREWLENSKIIDEGQKELINESILAMSLHDSKLRNKRRSQQQNN